MMSLATAQLDAVVEAPWYEGSPLWPWPIPTVVPFSQIVLSSTTPDLDIGLVVAQLVSYAGNLDPTGDNVLARLTMQKSRILPGGLRLISADGRVISPGCCCGLETWREWWAFLSTGDSPWLGHDPDPWIESLSDVVRVWSAGGLSSTEDRFAIELTREEYENALQRVTNELQGFLLRLHAWATTNGVPDPVAFVKKFDKWFHISK